MLAYVSIYASFSPLNAEILPASTAFIAMVIVTASSITYSVKRDALPAAILATVGGLLTPVLISDESSSHHLLFTYLLILDIGVLAAACYRRWRSLDTLAFIGTFALFGLAWLQIGQSGSRIDLATWGYAFGWSSPSSVLFTAGAANKNFHPNHMSLPLPMPLPACQSLASRCMTSKCRGVF